MLVATYFIHSRHDTYLTKMATVRDELVRIVGTDGSLFGNMQVAKLFHPGWGAPRTIVIGGWDYGIALAQAKEQIAAELLRRPGNVFVATWSRHYRAETPAEQQLMEELKTLFSGKVLPPSERGKLPHDVQILQLK